MPARRRQDAARARQPWALVRDYEPGLGPVWALQSPGILVIVGPAYGPASHVHHANALRALAQLDPAALALLDGRPQAPSIAEHPRATPGSSSPNRAATRTAAHPAHSRTSRHR